MTVDHRRPAAERFHPRLVGVGVPLQLGRSSLAEAVDIEDGGQVVQPVERGLVEGLPDRALGQFAVAAECPDMVGELVEVTARQRHTNRDR